MLTGTRTYSNILPMLEMDRWAALWKVVPPDAITEKGDLGQTGGSTIIAEAGSGYSHAEFLFDRGEEIEARRCLRRLQYAFVREQNRRIRAKIDLTDALSNVVGWRYERVAVEGRITRRGDSLNGGRYRNWRDVSKSVLVVSSLGDDWRWHIGLNEPDEEVGEGVQEQPDWKALARINAGWQEPTIGSATSFQYRVRESNP